METTIPSFLIPIKKIFDDYHQELNRIEKKKRTITEYERSLYSEPFTKLSALNDLRQLSDHDTFSTSIRGITIKVDRGCVAKSVESLAKRWQWSHGKVRRFLENLEDNGIVKIRHAKPVNIIQIVDKPTNKYQSLKFMNGNKVMLVQFKDDGSIECFGSKSAIFQVHTANEIGATYDTIANMTIDMEHPYENKHVIIMARPLIRKNTKRNKKVP